ncbi:MAG: 2-oxoglutarate and iron-dependent oxygenase domain-containing protein [Chitinophagales bacterium]
MIPHKIPIIDIEPLFASNSDSGSYNKTIKEIAQACRKNGFFYISGHSISGDLQNKLEALSKVFFELPLEEKMKISMQKGGKAWRGYFPIGDELTSGKPDQKEGLYFGSELDSTHPKVKAGIPLHGSNLFPEYPSEMKAFVLEYMSKLEQIGHALMKGISLSVGLEEDFFHRKFTYDPTLLFRIFHYPAQEEASENWGVGEHTDYGLLTILKQDTSGGLQVKSKGQWIDAPPIENTFICNIGDMLDKMTGGLYKSTPHRVRNTSGKGRLSFPFFFDPSFDAEIKKIVTHNPTQDDYQQRWDKEDVHAFGGTYGEYLLQKVGKVFPDLKDGLN